MLEFPAGCGNAQVIAAQRSRRRRRVLIADLATYTYRFPRNTLPNLDEDVPGDFFLFCHAKLQLMVEQFEERGIPFEHYVNSVLRWQLRSFLRLRNQAEQEWQNALYSELWDSREALFRQQCALDPALAPEPEPEPEPTRSLARAAARHGPRAPAAPLRLADPATVAIPELPRPPHIPRRARAPRFRLPTDPIERRMVFALFKTAHKLDERQRDLLVAATGCDPTSLRRLFVRLERVMERTRRREQMLRERRNLAFADYQTWSAFAWLEPVPEQRERARRRAARFHFTLVSSRAELARVRTAPSNRIIAGLLGIPKGTVDTSLNRLRRSSAARYACRDGVGSGQQQSAQGHRGAPHLRRQCGTDTR